MIEYLAKQRKAEEDERVRKEAALNEKLEIDSCEHEGVETEEAFVCRRCGLVLDNLYLPEYNWTDRCVIPRQYRASDRLDAVDRALDKFLNRISLQTYLPMYIVQSRLRAMKIDAGYKSLNYAIALSCILEGDEALQEEIRPYLPRSNNAWARSMRLMAPPPAIFVQNWLKNLLKRSTTYVPPTPSRDLSKQQEQRFKETLERFDDVEHQVRRDLVTAYDSDLEPDDFSRLPSELRIALYKFAMAVRFK